MSKTKIFLHNKSPEPSFLGLGVYGSTQKAHSEHGSTLQIEDEDILTIDPINKGFVSSDDANAIPQKFDFYFPSFELLVKDRNSNRETIYCVVSQPDVQISDEELSRLRAFILKKHNLTADVDTNLNFADALRHLHTDVFLDENLEIDKIDLYRFMDTYGLGDFDLAMIKLEGDLQNALQELYGLPVFGISDFVVDSTALLDIAKDNGYLGVRLVDAKGRGQDVFAFDPDIL